MPALNPSAFSARLSDPEGRWPISTLKYEFAGSAADSRNG
jgi:hypothetical protein